MFNKSDFKVVNGAKKSGRRSTKMCLRIEAHKGTIRGYLSLAAVEYLLSAPSKQKFNDWEMLINQQDRTIAFRAISTAKPRKSLRLFTSTVLLNLFEEGPMPDTTTITLQPQDGWLFAKFE